MADTTAETGGFSSRILGGAARLAQQEQKHQPQRLEPRVADTAERAAPAPRTKTYSQNMRDTSQEYANNRR